LILQNYSPPCWTDFIRGIRWSFGNLPLHFHWVWEVWIN
jgi:hypothetical protein